MAPSPRSVLRRLVDRVAAAARRRDRLPPAVPATGVDPLDAYARAAPNAQQTVDIFKGMWSSRFPPDTGLTAGEADLFDDPRLRALFARVNPSGARVLELGPLEGAHSAMLLRAGAASVLAIEACVLSYLKCLIVKDLLGLDRVTFQFGDFMPALAEPGDTFDLILASGVLYHQRDPVECLRRLALHGDCVYLWTHYYDEAMPDANIRRAHFQRTRSADVDGFACDLFRLEYDTYLPGGKYRGGVDDHSHWMRKADLLACLDHVGLGAIEILAEQIDHPYAPNLTLIARRSPARAPGVLAARQRRLELETRADAGPVPWCVDAATLADGWLDVAGWAIPPDGDPARVGIRVNGREASSFDTGVERQDVGFHYWFLPGANRSGFRLQAPIDLLATAIALEYIDRTTGAPLDPWHAFHVRPAELASGVPVPSLPQIRRAHAGNTANQYLVEGYSTFVKLQQAMTQVAGRAMEAFTTVLDFGCGCGRVTRYLASGHALIGVDIDADSIDWCRASLPGVFHVGSLEPPLDLPSASVDLVVAIDVVIHFREADGLRWIEELARVSRPGAILLISIAATRALARARLSADHHATVRNADFIDLSRNDDLDAVLLDRDYYRNVFHSHHYIRTEWTRFGVQVLDIIPGVIGNHNDLVVLTKQG